MTFKQLNHETNERYLDLSNPTLYGLIPAIRTKGRTVKSKKSKEVKEFSVISQYVGEAKNQQNQDKKEGVDGIIFLYHSPRLNSALIMQRVAFQVT